MRDDDAMKNYLVTTLLLLFLTGSKLSSQTLQYLAPGCGGSTGGYPWLQGGYLKYRGIDLLARYWPCERGTSGVTGWNYLVLSVPSAGSTPIWSPIWPCAIRGIPVIVYPRLTSGWVADYVVGKVPNGVDFYIQSVFVLYPTGNSGTTCPNYVSVTPAWRVKS